MEPKSKVSPLDKPWISLLFPLAFLYLVVGVLSDAITHATKNDLFVCLSVHYNKIKTC